MGQTPRTTRQVYTTALRLAERRYVAAQDRLLRDDSDESLREYARARADYEALNGGYPFIYAGAEARA